MIFLNAMNVYSIGLLGKQGLGLRLGFICDNSSSLLENASVSSVTCCFCHTIVLRTDKDRTNTRSIVFGFVCRSEH